MLYLPVVKTEIQIIWYYKGGGQAGKTFECIEDVAEFFKDQPGLRKQFTRSELRARTDRGDDLDDNF